MDQQLNRSGFSKKDYSGAPSTLCKGCGHDTITSAIIAAFYELGISPYHVAKLSGIGCSSKTPAYFINLAHGFNGVHGRMPAAATGAALGNSRLVIIGVSGDGDTASIGLGQFAHMIRRNVNLVYLIENNGTYGLTKGQFSATADVGSTSHYGEANVLPSIDCAALAIQMGTSFVARSFSGDRKQLVPLIKAAISHKGAAILDVISPCVTFNDHGGSTKSYAYVKEHDIALHEIDFVPPSREIEVEIAPGQTQEVRMHDGSLIVLKKLHENYDPTNKLLALQTLEKAASEKQLLTGLIYVNPKLPDLSQILRQTEKPLAHLGELDLRPSKEMLDEINKTFL